ncbi:sortase domain-bontaining protein [Solicola sp. PLA-1-18]|uniref:sortase domain-containing protein n=1 Tax=Solicola sp. PLA-1-18 TaxID=3380532 RepID=UPI003B7F48D4
MTALADRTSTPARGTHRTPPRQQPGPSRRPASAGWWTPVVTMVALVCLWSAAQMLVLGSLAHDRAQTLAYDALRTDLASATAPVGPVVPVGTPVALVTAPAIDLQEVVTEGTASGDLLGGPGHRRDTVLPGQQGISVVYGRGATYGAPFGRIGDLRRGDRLDVVAGQGSVSYTVLGVRRAGDPLPAAPASGTARLTLVSAEGTGRLTSIDSGSAVYVDAEATKGFPAPSGRAPSVPDSERAMAADPAALPLLALALGALTAVCVAVAAATARWSTALVWVLAAPVAMALAWFTTDVVMRLLPNLI